MIKNRRIVPLPFRVRKYPSSLLIKEIINTCLRKQELEFMNTQEKCKLEDQFCIQSSVSFYSKVKIRQNIGTDNAYEQNQTQPTTQLHVRNIPTQYRKCKAFKILVYTFQFPQFSWKSNIAYESSTHQDP